MFSFSDLLDMDFQFRRDMEEMKFMTGRDILSESGNAIEILAKYKLSKQQQMDTNIQAGPSGLKTSGLTFNEAMKAMHDGFKVRLPEWTGYWFMNNGEMSVFTREGDILNTPDFKKFGSRDDWELAIPGLGFDFAILALKSGKLLARGVWADRMIFMRPSHTMTAGYILITDQSLPGPLKSWLKGRFTQTQESLGMGAPDKELEPISLSGYLCSLDVKNNIMNGWTPSQDDMFATDWQVIQVPEWSADNSIQNSKLDSQDA